MPRWRWTFRRGGPGRPFGYLMLSQIPHIKEFMPNPCANPEPIELTYPEYDIFILIDLDGLTQEEAAKRMNTSRGTIWRLLSSSRKKIAQALNESRPLIVSPSGEIKKL
jgi:hypothetical protein